MKVKSKRLLSMFLSVAVITGLAVGCGLANPETSTEISQETSPETSPEVSSEIKTEEIESTGEKISLLLTYSEEKKVLYQCIEDFTKETGIEVEIQYMPLEDSRKQISVMVASGSLPDVMDIDNTDTQTYTEMGILADLTERVEAEIETGQYYEGVLESQKVDGKYYGLPFTANNLCLYYNKDLLEQAGAEVPATWEELLDACEKLKAAGVTGFGVAGSQTTDTSFQMWPFIWGAGADEKTIDSEQMVEMLNLYRTMVDNEYMSTEVINYVSGDNANQFTAGKTAIIIDGPWRMNAVKADAEFEWGVAQVPAGPAGEGTVLGGHNFAVVENENTDASWKFVKYMNSPEVMGKYSEAENYIPSRKDVCENLEYYKTEPISVFVEAMNTAKPMPKKNYNSVSDALIKMWQKVVLGESEPEAAAKEAAETVAALE